MKLVLCTKCFDVVKIVEKPRWCSCGTCSAVLTDPENARVYGGGDAVVLGFDNTSLAKAIVDQRSMGDLWDLTNSSGITARGREFEAFIIPDSAASVCRVSAMPEARDRKAAS